MVARLHELSQGDADFERELLDCLLADVANGMARLANTLDPLDPVKLANTLHGLVGACRTVGAESFGMLCRACENQAREPGFQPDPAWLGGDRPRARPARRGRRSPPRPLSRVGPTGRVSGTGRPGLLASPCVGMSPTPADLPNRHPSPICEEPANRPK